MKTLLIVLQLMAAGADASFTQRDAQSRYFREHDPIARPFVIHGTFERAGYFAVSTGMTLTGAELLEHFGHRRIARAVRLEGIADSASCAAYTASH